jgi:hypothetical protein
MSRRQPSAADALGQSIDPTASAKRTVTCLRSPSSAARPAGSSPPGAAGWRGRRRLQTAGRRRHRTSPSGALAAPQARRRPARPAACRTRRRSVRRHDSVAARSAVHAAPGRDADGPACRHNVRPRRARGQSRRLSCTRSHLDGRGAHRLLALPRDERADLPRPAPVGRARQALRLGAPAASQRPPRPRPGRPRRADPRRARRASSVAKEAVLAGDPSRLLHDARRLRRTTRRAARAGSHLPRGTSRRSSSRRG